MTKAEISADLKRYCGGSFITRKQLANYMGYAATRRVDKFIDGLDRINGTRYYCGDVAEQILKYRT